MFLPQRSRILTLAAAALLISGTLPLYGLDEPSQTRGSSSTAKTSGKSSSSTPSTSTSTSSSRSSSTSSKAGTSSSVPRSSSSSGSSTGSSSSSSSSTRSSSSSSSSTGTSRLSDEQPAQSAPPANPIQSAPPAPPLQPEAILVPAPGLPRGTLGSTYFRISHPVPSDKHPRLGMLAVRDHRRHPVVTVQNMGGLRLKSGVWLFESSRPLDPGVSQVVRVEAREEMQDVAPYTTRFVRLIPGRIVYLDFSDPAED